MLSQEDLQQLRIIIREEVKGELQIVKDDVQSLKSGVQHLGEKLDKEIEDMAELYTMVAEVVENHRTRIERLEKHTNIGSN